MEIIFLVFLYVAVCYGIGLAGSDKDLGFTGAFLISLLITPIVGLIMVLVAPDKENAQSETTVTIKKDSAKLVGCPYCRSQIPSDSFQCPKCQEFL